MCETDIVKQSDIKSLLLKQCDQDINEKNSTPPPQKKKRPTHKFVQAGVQELSL